MPRATDAESRAPGDRRPTTDDPTAPTRSRSRSPALLDEAAVAAALDAQPTAELALVEAKQQVRRTREAVREALFVAGEPYRDGRRSVPTEDLHRLYRDHRELRPGDVANAVGITSTELARRVGTSAPA